LYTSIITGQFFQGSQIRISDSLGIVTNATSPQSTLTITTDAPHGFGVNTPFYFLNLNSTISQTFDSSNTGSKTFDASNTATAQTFDGSNTLNRVVINLNNSPTTGGAPSPVVTTNTSDDTITVTHSTESFRNQPLGTPLYYSVAAAQGHFATNPRGVVYLKSTGGLGTSSSTFQVSTTPNGPVLDLVVSVTGTFQLAPLALRFPGNNTDEVAPTLLDVVEGTVINFDGANNLGSTSTVNSFSNGSAFIQMTNNAGSGTSTGLFAGSMVRYSTTGTAAGGLTNNTTYWLTFINVVVNVAPGLVQIKLAATPGGPDIVISSQGTGTHSIQQIGVSLDTDTFYLPAHGLLAGDMVKYTYPSGGRITTSETAKDYYFVERVLDANNVLLYLQKGQAKDGSSATRAANSALDILRVRPNAPDGAYWIKPDEWTGDPYQVWCNMTLEGGGWMLVFRNATEEFGAASRTPFGEQDFLVGSWTGWTFTTKTQIDGALGGSTNVTNYAANNGTNAFSPVYISAPFNDVMVIANRDSGRRLGWRHNNQISTMRSVINTTTQTLGNTQLFAPIAGSRAGYWQPMLDKRSDTQGTTDRGFNIYGFKIGSDRHGNDFGSPRMAGGWPNDATQGNTYNGTRGGWYNAQVGWAATDATTAEVVPQVGGGFGGICAAGSYHRLNHHVWGWGSSRNQSTWDPDRSSGYYGHAVYVRRRPA
jgi:hypothetical protein